MSDTARELVAQMVEAWEWPKPELLQEILDRGDEAVEPLLEVVRREYDDEEGDAPLWHAVGLLSDLHAAAAVPDFIELFYRYEPDQLEEFSADLARLGPPVIEPALAVVRDETRDWYVRAQASEAAIDAAGGDRELRARIAATLREVLAGYVARAAELGEDDIGVVSSLVADLAGLADPEGRPLVDAAFEAGIVDLMWIRREDVDERYSEPGREAERRLGEWLDWYRSRYREHLDEERRSRSRPADVPQVSSGPPAVSPLAARPALVSPGQVVQKRKLGRNDPCWCGSGKKYKRCHLDADRKLA